MLSLPSLANDGAFSSIGRSTRTATTPYNHFRFLKIASMEMPKAAMPANTA